MLGGSAEEGRRSSAAEADCALLAAHAALLAASSQAVSSDSSAGPLHGLLWPEVDAEAMPGAGSAKRLGVRGSDPPAGSTSELACCSCSASRIEADFVTPAVFTYTTNYLMID